MPPAPAYAAGTPSWRPRGPAGRAVPPHRSRRWRARRPEQRRDHAVSAGDVTHLTPLAVNQHDPSIRHGHRWRPLHRPQQAHTLGGATDISPSPGAVQGRDRDRAGGPGGRPGRAPRAACLGRTVGTSSYRCPVITRATAAEPAPGRSRPLDEFDFVIVDVETTGWTPGEARITEIGAVKISGGRVAGAFLVAGQSRRRDSRASHARSPASATRWSRPRPRWRRCCPASWLRARLRAHRPQRAVRRRLPDGRVPGL